MGGRGIHMPGTTGLGLPRAGPPWPLVAPRQRPRPGPPVPRFDAAWPDEGPAALLQARPPSLVGPGWRRGKRRGRRCSVLAVGAVLPRVHLFFSSPGRCRHRRAFRVLGPAGIHTAFGPEAFDCSVGRSEALQGKDEGVEEQEEGGNEGVKVGSAVRSGQGWHKEFCNQCAGLARCCCSAARTVYVSSGSARLSVRRSEQAVWPWQPDHFIRLCRFVFALSIVPSSGKLRLQVHV